MKHSHLGWLALLSLISTTLFLVLFITDTVMAGPLDTFEHVLAHAGRQTLLSRLAYANVTLLTMLVPMLFAGLYILLRKDYPLWALAGLVFIPVYAAFNLFAYFSQITVVPRLLELRADPALQAMADFWLRQLLQSWPASAVSVFNNTAYGLLGIPSILYGLLLPRRYPRLRTAGVLLALNGAACLLGVLGYVLRSELLSFGSLVGAVFFFLALFPLAWEFLRGDYGGA